MQRDSQTIIISVLKRLRLIQEPEESLPLLPLQSVAIEPPPFFFDKFADVKPISKATTFYKTAKEIHQKIVESREEKLAPIKKQKQAYDRLFIFLVSAGSLGIAVLSALMTTRFTALKAHYDAISSSVKAEREPIINNLQQLFTTQIEAILLQFDKDERPRIKELLCGVGMQKMFSWFDRDGLHAIGRPFAVLFGTESERWINNPQGVLGELKTCWTDSGVYRNRWPWYPHSTPSYGIPDSDATLHTDDCEHHTIPAHPSAICYDILKNICDMFKMQDSDYLSGTHYADQYNQALFTGYKKRQLEMVSTPTLYDSWEAWILGGVCVTLGLLMLFSLIYLFRSYQNTRKEYADKIGAADREKLSHYLDGDTTQKLKTLTSGLEIKVDSPTDDTAIKKLEIKEDGSTDTAIKKLQQTGRLLRQQLFGKYLVFQHTSYKDAPSDIQHEITAHLDEKLDEARDMPLLAWIKKPLPQEPEASPDQALMRLELT